MGLSHSIKTESSTIGGDGYIFWVVVKEAYNGMV